MKNLIIGGVIVALAVAGYMIGTGGWSDNSGGATENSRESAGGDSGRAVSDRDQRPDESLRVRGRVMSISETQIIVGTYDQGNRGDFDRSEIAQMSDSEREEFRAQRQAERAGAGEPEITGEKIVMLTVDTQYVRGSGPAGRGPQARDADRDVPEQESIDIDEVVEGVTVMVILKEGTREAVTVSVQEVRQ